MSKIVYPALVVLVLSILMVVVTEVYVRFTERRRFTRLNNEALDDARKELLAQEAAQQKA